MHNLLGIVKTWISNHWGGG